MERFLDESSCRDLFSLAAIRAILNSKQVNKDCSKHYYAISLFLDKTLDGYLQCYAEIQLDLKDPNLKSSKGTFKLPFVSHMH